MRRNRALAEALFGIDASASQPPQISIMPDMGTSSPDEDEPLQPARSPTKPLYTPKRSDSLRHATSPTAATTPPVSAMPTSPTGMLSPLSPTAGMTSMQLALEVQRRAEAATAALRKSPSIPKINDGGSAPRKRISPNKISAPTLVSASTSVDAIPLLSPTSTPTPSPGSGSKIGSRFKKLRGTIRAKPVPSGDEVTPYPLDLRNQEGHGPALSSASLAARSEPMAIPSSASAAEPRFKAPAPLPSPPASATPGLKGFMARFRKQRAAGAGNGAEHHLTPPTLVVPVRDEILPQPQSATSAKSAGPFVSGDSEFPEEAYPSLPRSAPALQTMFRSTSPIGPPQTYTHMHLPPSQSPTPRPGSQPLDSLMAPRLPSPPHADEDALKQLFDAANNLGLDQAALNDLIARSPSTSSRSTAWTKLTRATSTNDSRKSSQLPVIRGRQTPDSVRSPPMSEGRPSLDGYSPRPSAEIKSSRRKSQDPPPRPRHQQERERSAQHDETRPNTIVRRTIIVPSDARISTMDLQALMRKQSTSRRRASVSSGRSIHDRVPTPPPPHRGGARRFSTDAASPPMPILPPSLAVQTELLTVPSPVEKSSSSAYDSL